MIFKIISLHLFWNIFSLVPLSVSVEEQINSGGRLEIFTSSVGEIFPPIIRGGNKQTNKYHPGSYLTTPRHHSHASTL